MNRKTKPNRRQLPLFPGFDARQRPLYPHSQWATAVTPTPPPKPMPPVRCTCLDPAELDRLDAIGGLENERIFTAERGE